MYTTSRLLERWYRFAHQALWSRRRPNERRRTRRAGRWVPQFEGLESRLVPTCSPSSILNGVLTLSCDNSGNQIETYVTGRGTEFAEQIFRYRNGSGYSTTGDFYSRFSSIRINAGRAPGNNTITIDDNAAPLLVDGSSNVENVIIGKDGHVFSADITVRNSFGGSSIQVNDASDTSAMTATLTDTRITLPGRTTINYRPEELRSVYVTFGNTRNTINVLNTPAPGRFGVTTFVNPGRLDQVNVLGTSGPLFIESRDNDSVTIGNGHLDGIRGPVSMSNIYPLGVNIPVTALTVDNQADTGNRTVTLGPTAISFGGLALRYGSPLTGILLRGGTGTNIYTVTGTPPHQTGNVVLETRGTGDQARVLANAAPVIIAGSAPNHVEVGNNGRLTNILSDVSVSNPRSTTDLVSDDSTDPGSVTVTITGGLVSYGNPNAVLRYSNVANLTVRTGTGAETANVLGTFAGATSVAGGGPLTVNVGNAGTVLGIQAPLFISDPAGQLATVINDSADPTPPAGPITLSYSDPNGSTEISGLAPGAIFLGAAPNTTHVASLLLGVGDKIISVQSALPGVALSLDAGSGTNTLDYTNYPDNVLVNLQTGTATGFAGGIANVENVTGASGGPARSYNILVGNGGNVLTGGSGRRNLLVAGASASTLIGGNDDDILIGGTTAYDQEADMASLRAIMDYWAATADDYFTRVTNLTSGNGVPLLDATTVTGNGGGNVMNGNGALALIYSDGMDNISGFDPNSIIVPIAP